MSVDETIKVTAVVARADRLEHRDAEVALEKPHERTAVSNARDPASVLIAYADSSSVGAATAAEPSARTPINLAIVAKELSRREVREGLMEGYHLPEEYTSFYYDRRIFPYLDRPSFEGPDEPDVLYRGMYISLDELLNIVEKGFELSRTNWHTGGEPGVSFSSSATEARNYIFTEPRDIAGIGVVFEVSAGTGIEPLEVSRVNPTGTIYRSEDDVPPQRVVDILIWGRWGCERLSKVLEKIREGTVVPHEDWTNVGHPFGGR